MNDNVKTVQVSSASELNHAIESGDAATVQIQVAITSIPQPLLLKPGVKLEGVSHGAALVFEAGQDGIRISKDNSIENLELKTDPNRSAVYLHDGSLGRLTMNNLRVTGCIGLIAEGEGGAGDAVEAKDIHIVAADARSLTKGPVGFGVEIVPAAFTLLNRRAAASANIKADLRNISAGSSPAPVNGTGILIGGTPGGGEIAVSLLETGEMHSNSGLPSGTVRDVPCHGCMIDKLTYILHPPGRPYIRRSVRGARCAC